MSATILYKMLKHNPFIYTAQIFGEIIWDVAYFPLWWYSRGLLELVKNLKIFLEHKEKSLSLFVWLKNIFVPMYGQHDFWGALISFLMRIFQIIVRGTAMFFWLAAASLAVCFWMLLPLFVAYEIIFQMI
jgi:hypothetical protein